MNQIKKFLSRIFKTGKNDENYYVKATLNWLNKNREFGKKSKFANYNTSYLYNQKNFN